MSEIQADLGLSDKEIRNNLHRLQGAGYIRFQRLRYGLGIEVLKSKRWKAKQDRKEVTDLENADRKEVTDLNPSRSERSYRSDRKEVTDLDPETHCDTATSIDSKIISNNKQKQDKQEPLSADADALTISDEILRIAEYHKQHILPKSRMLPAGKEKIKARLKTFTPDELLKAIDNFRSYRDPKTGEAWWMNSCAFRGLAWFFKTDERIEQFLNLELEMQASANGNGKAHPPHPKAACPDHGWPSMRRENWGSRVVFKCQSCDFSYKTEALWTDQPQQWEKTLMAQRP